MPRVASQKRTVWSYPAVARTTEGLGMATGRGRGATADRRTRLSRPATTTTTADARARRTEPAGKRHRRDETRTARHAEPASERGARRDARTAASTATHGVARRRSARITIRFETRALWSVGQYELLPNVSRAAAARRTIVPIFSYTHEPTDTW